MKERKTIHDSDDGDSPLYVGIKYLGLVANQMHLIQEAEDEAYESKDIYCARWLNRLKSFYNLIANKTDIHLSDKEIDMFETKIENNELIKVKIKVKEKDKYEVWFKEIELMIERNLQMVVTSTGSSVLNSPRYKNDKKILLELGRCTRELYRDANAKHLIMPEGMKDMKDLVKSEWVDREAKKSFEEPSGKDKDF